MPRNISFTETVDQINDRSKTVTRRIGWELLQPGEILNACEKCMGLKKGEKIKKLCQIRVVNVRRERLIEMLESDVAKEGFPDMSRKEFINFFVQKIRPKNGVHETITRIEFEYL